MLRNINHELLKREVLFSDESTVQQYVQRKRHVRRPVGNRAFFKKFAVGGHFSKGTFDFIDKFVPLESFFTWTILKSTKRKPRAQIIVSI